MIDCLVIRYGRTRLETLEELVTDYIKFREDDYEDDDDLLQVMLEFQRRKEELRIAEKEWCAVWMLMKVEKRKGMEHSNTKHLEMF